MKTVFKVCSTCKENKPASTEFFNKKSSTIDNLQNVCKLCAAKASKKHYENNKEKVKQRTRERVKRIKPLAQQLVFSYLKKGCIDCGEGDIIVLHFDHLRDKKHSIANMIHSAYSLDKLEEEISKCEVRCANCHIRKTAKDFNWWKLNYDLNDIQIIED